MSVNPYRQLSLASRPRLTLVAALIGVLLTLVVLPVSVTCTDSHFGPARYDDARFWLPSTEPHNPLNNRSAANAMCAQNRCAECVSQPVRARMCARRPLSAFHASLCAGVWILLFNMDMHVRQRVGPATGAIRNSGAVAVCAYGQRILVVWGR